MKGHDLHITASDRGITALGLGDGRGRGVGSHTSAQRASVLQCRREFREYFAGKRTTFSFSLDLRGTPFQQKVWKALGNVPYGSTITYSELAKRAGVPRAVRAVASAVARNPVGIVVPCHRIVPASGSQPGKYAWGTEKKRWLLELEKRAKR